MRVLVCLPTYNERENLERMVPTWGNLWFPHEPPSFTAVRDPTRLGLPPGKARLRP
jgi:hypothetical protein